MAFRLTPSPTQDRIFARSVTPVIPNSSDSAEEVIDLSSPFNLPSPTSLLRSLSTAPSRPSTSSQNSAKTNPRHEAVETRAALENSPGRVNMPVTGSTKNDSAKRCQKKKQHVGNSTQTEFQIVDGDRIALSPKKAEKKAKATSRRKKSDGLDNKKLHGRVSKANRVQSVGNGKKSSNPAGHDQTTPAVIGRTESEPDWREEGLQLERATTRRLDWTPPKGSSGPVVDLVEIDSSPSAGGLSHAYKPGTLFSSYGFSRTLLAREEPESSCVKYAPTQKRPIAFLNMHNSSGIRNSIEPAQSTTPETSEDSLTKPRGEKAKKAQKATTITSYATARYNAVDSSGIVDTLSGQSNKKSSANRTSGTNGAKPSRKKSSISKKKEEPPAYKVVPPLEAFKSIERQELCFGTSSQLEHSYFGDQPDTFQTLHAHNPTKSPPPPRRPISSHTFSSRRPSVGLGLSKLSGSKNLWSASARDLTGTVAEVDVIDLTQNIEGSIAENEDMSTTQPQITTTQPSNKKTSPQAPSSMPIASRESAPPADKPIFAGFTTSELAKQVGAYGFKPIKSRDKMISLLEKCWENQNKLSEPPPQTQPSQHGSNPDGSVAEYMPKSTHQPGSLSQKTKLNTNKAKTARYPTKPPEVDTSLSVNQTDMTPKPATKRTTSPCTILIDDEVEESAWEVIPSTPPHDSYDEYPTTLAERTTPEPIPPTTPITIRSRQRPSQSSAQSLANPPDLSSQITKAIKAQPRLRAFNGAKRPTWYEKILMYDPIQLEDLATWLNTDGFDRIGEDREVGPGFVREWCESKGVCCVWKKTGGRA
ncbi:5'-flap endonuclease [Onygenales sp. PD_12]|nr:5'-flap endonuclease [Onygenales sp. PD_12]